MSSEVFPGAPRFFGGQHLPKAGGVRAKPPGTYALDHMGIGIALDGIEKLGLGKGLFQQINMTENRRFIVKVKAAPGLGQGADSRC